MQATVSSRACGGLWGPFGPRCLGIPETSLDPIRSISRSRFIFFFCKAPQLFVPTSFQSETTLPPVCQLVRPPFPRSASATRARGSTFVPPTPAIMNILTCVLQPRAIARTRRAKLDARRQRTTWRMGGGTCAEHWAR